MLLCQKKPQGLKKKKKKLFCDETFFLESLKKK